MIKITRSFARKINLGNYETADFYCQREMECENNLNVILEVTEKLHNQCKSDVLDSIDKYLKERNEPKRVDTTLGEKFQEEYKQRSVIDAIKEEQQ